MKKVILMILAAITFVAMDARADECRQCGVSGHSILFAMFKFGKEVYDDIA